MAFERTAVNGTFCTRVVLTFVDTQTLNNVLSGAFQVHSELLLSTNTKRAR